MCTPFSRLPRAQLLRLDSFFFGALCVMSGGRLPAELFMVFLLDSKGAKVSESCYNVDLIKSFQTSIYDLLAKICFDPAVKGPLKVCQTIAKS